LQHLQETIGEETLQVETPLPGLWQMHLPQMLTKLCRVAEYERDASYMQALRWDSSRPGGREQCWRTDGLDGVQRDSHAPGAPGVDEGLGSGEIEVAAESGEIDERSVEIGYAKT